MVKVNPDAVRGKAQGARCEDFAAMHARRAVAHQHAVNLAGESSPPSRSSTSTRNVVVISGTFRIRRGRMRGTGKPRIPPLPAGGVPAGAEGYANLTLVRTNPSGRSTLKLWRATAVIWTWGPCRHSRPRPE